MHLTEDIKMASFDLDDTLLIHGALSDKNKEALIKLHDCGCLIVINTGRGLRFVPEVCKQDYVDYIIVSNGSRIYDNHQKKFIKNISIESQDVETIYSIIRKQHAIKLMCDETTYTSSDMYRYYIISQVRKNSVYGTKISQIVSFLKNFTPKMNLKKFIAGKPEVFKMECNCRKNYNPEEMVKEINAKTKTKAVVVKGSAIETASVDAGKGKSLLYLADLHNIRAENIAAFGDSGNDIDALEVAGMAIAVGNATEPIKKVATKIIGLANEDGVGEYINSIIE